MMSLLPLAITLMILIASIPCHAYSQQDSFNLNEPFCQLQLCETHIQLEESNLHLAIDADANLVLSTQDDPASEELRIVTILDLEPFLYSSVESYPVGSLIRWKHSGEIKYQSQLICRHGTEAHDYFVIIVTSNWNTQCFVELTLIDDSIPVVSVFSTDDLLGKKYSEYFIEDLKIDVDKSVRVSASNGENEIQVSWPYLGAYKANFED